MGKRINGLVDTFRLYRKRLRALERAFAAWTVDITTRLDSQYSRMDEVDRRTTALEALSTKPTDIKQACRDVIAEATLGVRRDAEDAIKGLRECRQANSDLLARLYAAEQKIIALEREIRSPQELEKFRLAQVHAGAEY